jgi:hypothetical protein
MSKLTNELGLTADDLARHELTDADIQQVSGGAGDEAAQLSETTIIRGDETTIIRNNDRS